MSLTEAEQDELKALEAVRGGKFSSESKCEICGEDSSWAICTKCLGRRCDLARKRLQGRLSDVADQSRAQGTS